MSSPPPRRLNCRLASGAPEMSDPRRIPEVSSVKEAHDAVSDLRPHHQHRPGRRAVRLAAAAFRPAQPWRRFTGPSRRPSPRSASGAARRGSRRPTASTRRPRCCGCAGPARRPPARRSPASGGHPRRPACLPGARQAHLLALHRPRGLTPAVEPPAVEPERPGLDPADPQQPGRAHGSWASRALIAPRSAASTTCRVSSGGSPSPTGPPRMMNPSSTSPSMKAACSSQPSCFLIGREASQPGPCTSRTAKLAMPRTIRPPTDNP